MARPQCDTALVSPWGGEIIIKELEKPSKNWQFS
jgi:hypothetical protein